MTSNADPTEPPEAVAQFIRKWSGSGGAERANYGLFLTELCDMLAVPHPHPAGSGNEAYVFERDVIFRHADGSTSRGRIDLYKRGCFVLEAKQGGDQKAAEGLPLFGGAEGEAGKARKGTAWRGTKGWDDAMLRARGQAESYAKALPATEGWPPFLILVDVGHVIELFADFSGTGKHYTHFPDVHSFRLPLADLARPGIRERLRLAWTDPLALDPTRRSAMATREIAAHLAVLAKSLEGAGHAPKSVAAFLMRCLFTMFAEDVELLPKGCFTRLLKEMRGTPEQFAFTVGALWKDMNLGADTSLAIRAKVRQFNGGLFREAEALKLDAAQIGLLLAAAKADWKDVEPAIFGTLLERALDPHERHKLGAHYTPRAYVERLVLPTVIEPLREDWEDLRDTVVQLVQAGDAKGAVREAEAFHRKLCGTRVLDPACGTGNFLYVTLEHMKRLEGEVLDLLAGLGETQYLLELDRHTVTPAQFLGLEINPRAAAIADLVIWIGYLQWHIRAKGGATPAEPILKDFRNIAEKDAVLAWKSRELVRDEQGKPLSRWDGFSTRIDPVTGWEVPDDQCRVEMYRYGDPRPAKWPEADFIVGNPPFIGGKDLRQALGDGYAEALWATRGDLPDAIDFVMYWWDQAADLVRRGKARRFGFITTKAIWQTFSRRVIAKHLNARQPLSILFAIPNHPWVRAGGEEAAQIRAAAQVRVAMTVGAKGREEGRLLTVAAERTGKSDAAEVEFDEAWGAIGEDFRVGANVAAALSLRANERLCSRGMALHGAGFIVTPEEAERLGLGKVPGLEKHIRPYLNGRDLAGKSRNVMVIDLHGLTDEAVRKRFPAVYQRVLTLVKPARDHNNEAYRRDNWWLFGRKNTDLRAFLGGIDRFITTPETARHRYFVFLPAGTRPDNKLVNVGLADAFFLGILSSHVHVAWALATGGRLGVGNDPVYVKSACFDRFPFPDPPEDLKARVRELGEELDGFRQARQAEHSDLTLTGLYNVLEKLRTGAALSDKERDIHDRGLVSVLGDIHDRLDAAVSEAYGWPADLSDEDILERLVALNKERAAEEKQGRVRWLRPDFQAPEAAAREVQAEFAGLEAGAEEEGVPAAKLPWPKDLPGQFQAARAALAALGRPADARTLARAFKGARADRVAAVLDTMAQMGRVRRTDDGRFAA